MEKADKEREKLRQIETRKMQLEYEEQEKLMEKLQEMENAQHERKEKYQKSIINRKNTAKQYYDHILERLELLKIIDIVKKIETENNYLGKVEKIEKVRNKRMEQETEFLGMIKSKSQLHFDKATNNLLNQQKFVKLKNRDLDKRMRESLESLKLKEENEKTHFKELKE